MNRIAFAKGYASGVTLAMNLEADTIEQTVTRIESCMELVSMRLEFLEGAEYDREDGTYQALYEAHDKLSDVLIEQSI